jgi:hypothetical protein
LPTVSKKRSSSPVSPSRYLAFFDNASPRVECRQRVSSGDQQRILVNDQVSASQTEFGQMKRLAYLLIVILSEEVNMCVCGPQDLLAG